MKHVVTILFLFLSSVVLANEFPHASTDEIKLPEQPTDHSWSLGLSGDFGMIWGLTLGKKISSQWSLQSQVLTQGVHPRFGGGGNPSSEIPYGYEVDDYRMFKGTMMAVRRWEIDDKGAWSFFMGAGIGYSDTSAQVQFYNPWWIGYDRASVAGSDRIRMQDWQVPITIGVRRDDKKFFSQPAFVSLALEGPLPLDSTPKFRAPNGKDLVLQKDYFSQSRLALEGGIWF